jgi:hypothetical protein
MGKANRLFNGEAEQTLHRRITPSEEQIEHLRVQWNMLAEFLVADLQRVSEFPLKTWLQGSYKYATLIKPVHKGEEYDVDLGLYFVWNPNDHDLTPQPEQLRSWVQQSILDYADTSDDVESVDEPKERCSRAIYKKLFHIDTPTYHLNPDDDSRRLACLSKGWEPSDPKSIYKWFRDQSNSTDAAQLRRVIRYLKAWAAVAFDDVPNARPSSIVITVLTTQAFTAMWVARNDEDALIHIIRQLKERLEGDRRVPNPVDKKEDLNRIRDEDWGAFLTRLTALSDIAENADSAEDEAAGALAWSQSFLWLMPLVEVDSLEVEDTDGGRALMVVPDIEITVFDRQGGNLLATYMNEVPAVEKNRWLHFRIVQTQQIPAYSFIEWTVRNDGVDADDVGDLGHQQGGVDLTEVEEGTAYSGKHYMDCVVRVHGSAFALRRVPVHIAEVRKAVVNPGARNWVNRRSRRSKRR